MNQQMLSSFIDCQRQRREIDLKLAHLKQDLEARELFITPTGENYKALGTSDPDRKTVVEKTRQFDPTCTQIRAQIREFEARLSSLQASIDEYETLRRADEWEITRSLAEALRWRYTANHSNPAREAALDAAVRGVVGEENQPVIMFNDSDVPF